MSKVRRQSWSIYLHEDRRHARMLKMTIFLADKSSLWSDFLASERPVRRSGQAVSPFPCWWQYHYGAPHSCDTIPTRA